MSDKKSGAPKLSAQDKAERTTQAANAIMEEERAARDAKVARLKALRMAGETEKPLADSKPGANASASLGRPRAAAIRTLALQGAAPAKKPKVR